MKLWFIPLLAVAGLAFASTKAYEWRWRMDASGPPVSPASIQFKSAVAAAGLVEPSSENIAVSTPVAGLVMDVHVVVGTRVRKGAPLFSLDDRDLRAELDLRQSNLEVAAARLARLNDFPRPEEVPQLEAEVHEAEAALADAQQQLRLLESVSDKRAIREQDFLHSREAVNMAAARKEKAAAALALLNAGAWTRDIEVARAEVKNAQAQVQRIEADVERLTIRAPMDGTVLQVNIHAGEYAPTAQLAKPLLIIGQVDDLHIRADIDENDLWRLQSLARAQAVERGNGGRRSELEFVRLEPYVIPKRSLTGDSTERVDTRVLQAIYRFKDRHAPFHVGQQMDIFIEVPTEGAQ